MGYRDVQRSNTNRRNQLSKTKRQLLKDKGYKNIGWDQVIILYQAINDITAQSDLGEDSLEELFIKADRIGNKYQTLEEISTFNQQLAEEVAKVADVIDRQFPETEMEVINYSSKIKKQKSYLSK